MATWSKVKQQLESFLSPSLEKRVEYRASSYRYTHDKAGLCYITVDKKEIFSMSDLKYGIRWYQTEQEIAKDFQMRIYISNDEIEEFKQDPFAKNIPEDRLQEILKKRKVAGLAKEILTAQTALSKSDFFEASNTFLTTSIDSSLNSDSILLNVFAIIDRRVGKSRLRKMESEIRRKHPIVQYFYDLRCNSDNK